MRTNSDGDAPRNDTSTYKVSVQTSKETLTLFSDEDVAKHCLPTSWHNLLTVYTM